MPKRRSNNPYAERMRRNAAAAKAEGAAKPPRVFEEMAEWIKVAREVTFPPGHCAPRDADGNVRVIVGHADGTFSEIVPVSTAEQGR